MGALVLSIVFLLTVALGAAVARGVLSLTLRLLVAGHVPVPAGASLRAAAFVGALLAFWSLAPAIVESPGAALIALVR